MPHITDEQTWVNVPVESEPPAIREVRAILESKDFTDKQSHQLANMVRAMVEMMEGQRVRPRSI